MKLIVIIPCLNEAATLPAVLKTIPQKITAIDEIEIVVIDDGSTDKTVEVAKENGVEHFVSHIKNQGLSVSFCDGLNRALELGADIIVLTDGDNQYPQERIPDLIEPILKHEADLVIADRQIQTIDHFSATKKMWQRFGTWVMNLAAGTNVPDGTSGFRAYSRDAALQLNLIAKYSFATETTIQAGNKGQAIAFIKIKTNAKTRESRQFTSSWQHVRKSSITIMRGFVMYKPYAVFFSLGLLLLAVGLIPFIHYFVLYFSVKSPGGAHHLQSLIIGTVLLTAAFISFTLGVIADLIRINRRLLEDILEHTRRNDFSKRS